MNKETEILNTVKIRKLSYLGHIMRHPEKYELPILILQGKIAGKRGVGRRRISWLKNLRQWFNINTTGLFRAAVNKVMLANMIANVRWADKVPEEFSRKIPAAKVLTKKFLKWKNSIGKKCFQSKILIRKKIPAAKKIQKINFWSQKFSGKNSWRGKFHRGKKSLSQG